MRVNVHAAQRTSGIHFSNSRIQSGHGRVRCSSRRLTERGRHSLLMVELGTTMRQG